LANFSKEFYHWLMVGYNEAQRRNKTRRVVGKPYACAAASAPSTKHCEGEA
jgi:hypothetical protein